mmetsp:Transcript_21470/g.59559  ORF Transcript_21470/g.59559 Transcript_21470/m.59559 type:complete len:217 (-) Transcript_21470:103-753(-)
MRSKSAGSRTCGAEDVGGKATRRSAARRSSMSRASRWRPRGTTPMRAPTPLPLAAMPRTRRSTGRRSPKTRGTWRLSCRRSHPPCNRRVCSTGMSRPPSSSAMAGKCRWTRPAWRSWCPSTRTRRRNWQRKVRRRKDSGKRSVSPRSRGSQQMPSGRTSLFWRPMLKRRLPTLLWLLPPTSAPAMLAVVALPLLWFKALGRQGRRRTVWQLLGRRR